MRHHPRLQRPHESVSAASSREMIAGIGGSLTLPFVGFLTYVFVITTFRFPLGQWGVLTGLVGLLFAKDQLTMPRFFKWLTASLLWSLLTLLWSKYPDLTVTEVVRFFKLYTIVFLGVNAVRTRQQLNVFLLFLLFWFAVYPARGTVLNFVHGNTMFGRAAWNAEFANPNAMATATLVAITAATVLYRSLQSKAFRVLLICLVTLFLLVLLLTQSRSNFIALLAFGVVLTLHSRRRLQTALVVVLFSVTAAAFAPRSVWARLGGLAYLVDTETVALADEQGSALQRFEIGRTAVRIVGDHFLFGTGFGTYPMMNAEYSPETGVMDPHSTYLNVFAEQGLVGLVLFLGFLGTLFRQAVSRHGRSGNRLSENAIRVAEAGLVGVLVAALAATLDLFPYFYLSAIILHLTVVVDAETRTFARNRSRRRRAVTRTTRSL